MYVYRHKLPESEETMNNKKWGTDMSEFMDLVSKSKLMPMSRWEPYTGVHITHRHTGKMAGLASISTSPLTNKYCVCRSKNPELICSHCYSNEMQKQYSDLEKCLRKNSEILYYTMLSPCEMPRLSSPSGFFRWESFGDLATTIQVANYFHMTAANPKLQFALWTKNPFLIALAMNQYGLYKPENLTIIVSSPKLNDADRTMYDKYDFIDYVFTVYEPDYIREHGIIINCGARSCKGCHKCYTQEHDTVDIAEKLKNI